MHHAAGQSAILLTTCHLRNDGIEDLDRLIASIQVALRAGEVGNLRHIILLQACTSAQRQAIESRFPKSVELLSTEESLSSPAARNLMIQRMLGDDRFEPGAFVGFPDDDAWYPGGALGCAARHFSEPAGLQLLLCRYGPNPDASGCDKAFRPNLQQALSRGACAAIFVRAGLVARLGGFHESLGLGTTLCGGEDTEFVHRAFHLASGRVRCLPGVLVGHSAADPAKKVKYYEGGLAALIAHAHVSVEARMAMVRKLAVGAWMVLGRRMGWSQFVAAVRKAHANAPTVRRGPSLTIEIFAQRQDLRDA